MAVAPGSNPGSRVVSTDDATIIGQVVVNADGSAIGGGGAGGATAANQVTQITAEQAIQATVGATSGAAVITDANGTLQQYLRGLVKLIVAKITVLIDSTQIATLSTAANQTTQITAEQAIIPGSTAAAVTPSDATALTSRAVWVGGAGDLSVRLSGATGTTVVFTAVPAGSLIPISVVRVMAATTATNINVIN